MGHHCRGVESITVSLLVDFLDADRPKSGCRPNHPVDGSAFIVPSPLPPPPRKVKPLTPPPQTPPPRTTWLKRPAPDDDGVIDLEPTPKRVRTNGQLAPEVISSPSRKRKLEEDGLLLLDGANDQLEDSVIEID